MLVMCVNCILRYTKEGYGMHEQGCQLDDEDCVLTPSFAEGVVICLICGVYMRVIQFAKSLDNDPNFNTAYERVWEMAGAAKDFTIAATATAETIYYNFRQVILPYVIFQLRIAWLILTIYAFPEFRQVIKSLLTKLEKLGDIAAEVFSEITSESSFCAIIHFVIASRKKESNNPTGNNNERGVDGDPNMENNIDKKMIAIKILELMILEFIILEFINAYAHDDGSDHQNHLLFWVLLHLMIEEVRKITNIVNIKAKKILKNAIRVSFVWVAVFVLVASVECLGRLTLKSELFSGSSMMMKCVEVPFNSGEMKGICYGSADDANGIIFTSRMTSQKNDHVPPY